MSESSLFASVEMSFVLHATEDAKKVITPFERFLGVPETMWSYTVSQGHFGNRIATFTSIAEGGAGDNIAYRLASLLNKIDKSALIETLASRIDEKGNLYLRIDKQRLCKNSVNLTDFDPVRIKIKPKSRTNSADHSAAYGGIFSSIE